MDGFVKKRITFTGAAEITFATSTEYIEMALISGGPAAYSFDEAKTIAAITDDETYYLGGNVIGFSDYESTNRIALYSDVETTIQVRAR